MTSNTAKSRVTRMKRRGEFLAAQRAQRKHASAGMVVQVRDRAPGEKAEGDIRIGFTTSKKVGNAVARNRARRRLRACVDTVIDDIQATDLDIVLIGRKTTIDRPFSELRDDLLSSLRKLNVNVASHDRDQQNAC